MNKKGLLKFLQFLHQAEGLKRLLRHSWLSNGRRESVAEHSWRFALMAMVLGPKINQKINMSKLLKMVLVHDLGEVYGGDHWAFKKALVNKVDLERAGLKKILKKLPNENRLEILGLWEEYEQCQTAEAKLAKALDKMEVLIQHNEAKISSWNKQEYAFNFIYGDEFVQYSPILSELKQLIKDECRKKIDKEGSSTNT